MTVREYVVSAYHLTERMVRVKAASEAEAIQIVKDGGGECYDSEPGKDVFTPKWTATWADPARFRQAKDKP